MHRVATQIGGLQAVSMKLAARHIVGSSASWDVAHGSNLLQASLDIQCTAGAHPLSCEGLHSLVGVCSNQCADTAVSCATYQKPTICILCTYSMHERQHRCFANQISHAACCLPRI